MAATGEGFGVTVRKDLGVLTDGRMIWGADIAEIDVSEEEEEVVETVDGERITSPVSGCVSTSVWGFGVTVRFGVLTDGRMTWGADIAEIDVPEEEKEVVETVNGDTSPVSGCISTSVWVSSVCVLTPTPNFSDFFFLVLVSRKCFLQELVYIIIILPLTCHICFCKYANFFSELTHLIMGFIQ